MNVSFWEFMLLALVGFVVLELALLIYGAFCKVHYDIKEKHQLDVISKLTTALGMVLDKYGDELIEKAKKTKIDPNDNDQK